MSDQPTARIVRFGPRESRGWILGFRIPQLLLCVVALLVLSRMLQEGATVASRLGDALIVAAILVVAFLPIKGRRLFELVPVVANFGIQRFTGHDVFRGGVFRLRADKPDRPEFTLPGDLARLQLLSYEVVASDEELAVIKDPVERTYTGVLALEGSTFALLETGVQAARLDAYDALLTQLCQEMGVLRRLQIVERTVPDSGEDLYRDWTRRGVQDGSLQAANYEELLSRVGETTQTHETYLAVTLDARRAASEIRQAGGGDEGAQAVLLREMAGLQQGLVTAGVTVLGWVPPRGIGEIIRSAYDPASRGIIRRRGGAESDARGGDKGLPSGVDPRICGPMRAENEWDHYRTDSAVHRCWWILEWPRRDTPAGFLQPLLLSSTRQRTVSLILEPLRPTTANRRVNVSASSVISEQAVRDKIKKRTTRRQQVEASDTERREDDLVSGHGMYRMLGFVSVSAPDRDQLEFASGEIESLAQTSRLEVARLSGEHDQAFGCAALPLGRGLS